MKNKYIMVSGLAFSEETDLEKLSRYAKEGWLLEKIVGGFFYKLKKDKPQDIIYNLDYQREADEEYFKIFKEAGWNKVVSVSNYIHIFSAKVGTKPIYSDRESELDKYIRVRDTSKKGTIYSLIIGLILIGMMFISLDKIKSIFLLLEGLFLIDLIVFIFSFMPYVAFRSRVRKIIKGKNLSDKTINNKNIGTIYAFSGCVFLILGSINIFQKDFWGIISIIVGVLYAILSVRYYKK